MAKNAHLNQAKKGKNDEFYTRYEDIEKELINYDKKYFRDKVVYLPCDDVWSNFWKYFTDHFREYGLRELIASHYEKGAETVITHSYDGVTVLETQIGGDGDFRSAAVEPLWREADVIVTNPPFSLFIPFVQKIIEYDKLFLILGHQNSIGYKDIFPLIRQSKIWLGVSIHGGGTWFRIPDYYTVPKNSVTDNSGNNYVNFSGIRWFTNIDVKNNFKELSLTKKYSETAYERCDNYDAINVNVTNDIPCDYDGVIAVPLTYLDKHNPDKYCIVGDAGCGESPTARINGKRIFKRILIQKKRAV